MHLVSTEPPVEEPAFSGVPLTVVFAEGEAIELVRSRGTGSLALEPPFHVSDDDAYLVLPSDIGMEVIDILADGDLDLLHETMRDGLLVEGFLEKEAGAMALVAEAVDTPRTLLKGAFPYAASVGVGAADVLREINSLPHVQCTVLSSLMDDEGLDRALRRSEYVGPSWKVPENTAMKQGGVDPTYVWSKHQAGGRVGVELALFQEYEELVALIRPLELVA